MAPNDGRNRQRLDLAAPDLVPPRWRRPVRYSDGGYDLVVDQAQLRVDVGNSLDVHAGERLDEAAVGDRQDHVIDAGGGDFVADGEPAVIVKGASSEQRTRLNDAMARFGTAELRLPDLEIVFSDDESACEGHLGGFRRVEDAPHVSVCSDLEFVVLHELAHVWVDANVDEAARDRYLRWRGLDTWSDRAVPRGERGVEDAAFIVQQNLRDVAPSVLASATWTERMAAFEFLTGTRSPLRARAASVGPSAATDQGQPPKPCRRLVGSLWHVTVVLTRCSR